MNETISIEDQPLIFALDTSSKLTSLAIAKGARLIAHFGAELDDNRSARLWELTDFLLSSVGLKIEDADLFAVCVGPGGFTGLRVGMATIKGFAEALHKPVIAVTSLEARAAVEYPATCVCVLSNAYRGEVYWQLFSYDKEGHPKPVGIAKVGVLSQVLAEIAEHEEVIFTGDGAQGQSDVILQFHNSNIGRENSLENSRQGWSIRPRSGFLAERIAQLAYWKYRKGEAVSSQELEACYVRSADVKLPKQV
jgi:tRNA threonylcarbamoyladenosine biosynthesis protein TsaB